MTTRTVSINNNREVGSTSSGLIDYRSVGRSANRGSGSSRLAFSGHTTVPQHSLYSTRRMHRPHRRINNQRATTYYGNYTGDWWNPLNWFNATYYDPYYLDPYVYDNDYDYLQYNDPYYYYPDDLYWRYNTAIYPEYIEGFDGTSNFSSTFVVVTIIIVLLLIFFIFYRR